MVKKFCVWNKRCRWTENRQILSAGRMTVMTSDELLRHCLVICDVQLSDAGQYVVKLTDRTDQRHVQSSAATLVVIPRQLTTAGIWSVVDANNFARVIYVIAAVRCLRLSVDKILINQLADGFSCTFSTS